MVLQLGPNKSFFSCYGSVLQTFPTLHFLQYHRYIFLVCSWVPGPFLPKQLERVKSKNLEYIQNTSLFFISMWWFFVFFYQKLALQIIADAAGTTLCIKKKIWNVSSVPSWNTTPYWSRTDGFKERRNTSGAKKAEDVLQHIGPIGQTNVLTRNQGLWEHIRIHKRSKGAGMMRCRVECAGWQRWDD